jgi:hypothetical protein
MLKFDALKLLSLVQFLLNSLRVFFVICYFVQSANMFKVMGKMLLLHFVSQHRQLCCACSLSHLALRVTLSVVWVYCVLWITRHCLRITVPLLCTEIKRCWLTYTNHTFLHKTSNTMLHASLVTSHAIHGIHNIIPYIMEQVYVIQFGEYSDILHIIPCQLINIYWCFMECVVFVFWVYTETPKLEVESNMVSGPISIQF